MWQPAKSESSSKRKEGECPNKRCDYNIPQVDLSISVTNTPFYLSIPDCRRTDQKKKIKLWAIKRNSGVACENSLTFCLRRRRKTWRRKSFNLSVFSWKCSQRTHKVHVVAVYLLENIFYKPTHHSVAIPPSRPYRARSAFSPSLA